MNDQDLAFPGLNSILDCFNLISIECGDGLVMLFVNFGDLIGMVGFGFC
jgi:hypothetical protein